LRIVVLSPYLPHRRIGHGGGVSVRGLLAELARRHEVVLASLVRPGEKELLGEVTELGVEVIPLPFLDRGARGCGRGRLLLDRGAAWLRSLRSGYPLYVEKYWSRDLSRRLVAAVDAVRPDAVQIEYLQLSLLARDLHRQRAGGSDPARPRLVLASHEAGSLPWRRRAAAARDPLSRRRHRSRARAWERLERDATRWVDCTLCVTDQDRRLIESLGGRECRTVPLGIDTARVVPVWNPADPPRVLFVGSFGHPPNRAAAKLLVDKVWPRVAQYLQTCELILAGRGSSDFLGALEGRPQRVVALDYVEDLTPLYRECRLFAAPLTEGGGIKIKILEAMARGIPVVTTPIGVEGIVDPAEDAVFVGQPDATFAESMIHALSVPEQARRRAERARRIIEERFSWSAITDTLTSIYEGR
jgi:glycosyltransferase involved in cell wall biosynthesis